MLVPVQIVGGSSESRAPFVDNQKCLNLYPEQNGELVILNSYPGLKAFATGDGPDRGMFTHLGILYQVSGTSLFTITSAGVKTNRGVIDGAERCLFCGIGANVVIVSNGKAFQWNGTTLAEITDVDLETPNSCAHLNNQIIYDGDGGRWASSDVGDATSVNGLNYATAESNADDLVRVFSYDQKLYLFGDITTEVWWNSGNGNPPFDRIEVIIPVGLDALHSVASNDERIYFLGDDKNVYILKETAVQRISTVNIANQIQGFATTSDAQGHTFNFQGQNFYELTFPNANRTFCFSEAANLWFELSSQTSEDRYLASSHAFVFNKNLVADFRNGNIYELDIDIFDEVGEEILRIRDSRALTGEQLERPGKPITMSRFEVLVETGVGTSGQGLDPIINLLISDDGGRTFGTELPAKIGKSGDFIFKVEWFDLGDFYQRVLRLKMADPVQWVIRGANAEIEVGI